MEENLETALQRIFGGELMWEKAAAPGTVERPGETVLPVRKLTAEAVSHYRTAQGGKVPMRK
jgi:hypothetical protein